MMPQLLAGPHEVGAAAGVSEPLRADRVNGESAARGRHHRQPEDELDRILGG